MCASTELLEEITIKVILDGPERSGKSSYISLLRDGTPSTRYDPSVGVERTKVRVKFRDETTMKHLTVVFDIWELAGRKDFRGLGENYYGTNVAAVLVMYCIANYARASELTNFICLGRRHSRQIIVCVNPDQHADSGVVLAQARKVLAQHMSDVTLCYCDAAQETADAATYKPLQMIASRVTGRELTVQLTRCTPAAPVGTISLSAPNAIYGPRLTPSTAITVRSCEDAKEYAVSVLVMSYTRRDAAAYKNQLLGVDDAALDPTSAVPYVFSMYMATWAGEIINVTFKLCGTDTTVAKGDESDVAIIVASPFKTDTAKMIKEACAAAIDHVSAIVLCVESGFPKTSTPAHADVFWAERSYINRRHSICALQRDTLLAPLIDIARDMWDDDMLVPVVIATP